MSKKMGSPKWRKAWQASLQSAFQITPSLRDEFYQTMSHYCTVQDTRFERNVKVTDVFPEEINNPAVNKKEFDGVMYVGKTPKVIFEINGAEHFKNKKRIAPDKLKMQLAKNKDLKLMLVPNQ